MKLYSQKDPRWAGEKLGACKDTLAQSGCKITCYAMFLERNPSKINQDLKSKGGYVQGCLTVDATCAKILGLKFDGRTTSPPKHICIAETDHYKKYGVPQHFFVYNPTTKLRVDPLDLKPEWEKNDYRIVSYRLFHPLLLSETIKKEEAKNEPVVVPKPESVPMLTEQPKTPQEVIPEVKEDSSDQAIQEPATEPSHTAEEAEIEHISAYAKIIKIIIELIHKLKNIWKS